MRQGLKRLIGSFLIVILVIVYAVAATLVAETRLAQSGTLAHFAYFLFSGLLWVLPAMLIVKWMYGAPKKADLRTPFLARERIGRPREAEPSGRANLERRSDRPGA